MNGKWKDFEVKILFMLIFCYHCLIFSDTGTIWCATVEIKVGRSEWPLNQEFVTLAPTSSVMTPQDCRLESSFNKTRMFGPSKYLLFKQLNSVETMLLVKDM